MRFRDFIPFAQRGVLVALLAMIVLLSSLLCLFAVFYPGLNFGRSDIDAPVLTSRAREDLAAVLGNYWGLTLDPSAEVVASYEERDGARGEGARWFLVDLAPGGGRRFEEQLVRIAKADPRTRRVSPIPINSIGTTTTMPPWWKPESLANARAIEIDNSCRFYFVFSDKFSYIYIINF